MVHHRHAVGVNPRVTSSDARSATSIGPSSAFGARYRRLMRALIDCASPSRTISTGPDVETQRSRPGSRASTTTEAETSARRPSPSGFRTMTRSRSGPLRTGTRSASGGCRRPDRGRAPRNAARRGRTAAAPSARPWPETSLRGTPHTHARILQAAALRRKPERWPYGRSAHGSSSQCFGRVHPPARRQVADSDADVVDDVAH